MEGTIDKLKVQVNKLSKTLNGNLMPNNIQLIFDHSNEIFKKEFDEFNKLQQSGKLSDSELEEKRLIVREKELNLRNKYKNYSRTNNLLNLPDSEKLITLDKFKDNLNKVERAL